MLTELVFFLAILLMQNKAQAFALLCLTFILMDIRRRITNKEQMPFTKAAIRDFGRARAIFRRASSASVIVYASGCLFLAGLVYLWVLPAVASVAVLWVVEAWLTTRPTQQSDSTSTDSSQKPAVAVDIVGSRR